MKKILLGGMLGLLMCMSCTEQPVKQDFIDQIKGGSK